MLILLVVSMVCFFGCARVEYIRAIDPSGVIIDRLVVELDESKINKAGKTLAEVRSSIEGDMMTLRSSVQAWKNDIGSRYPELSDSIEIGITCLPPTTIGNKVSQSIEFANWKMFGIYYGLIEIDGVEYDKVIDDVGPFVEEILKGDYTEENAGLFTYKYAQIKDKNILSNIKDAKEVGGNDYSNLYDKYRNYLNNYYDIDDLKMVQTFTYPLNNANEKLYTNADEVEIAGGVVFMQWDLNDNDDSLLEIYKLAPRMTAWYVLAIIISITVLCIIVINVAKKSAQNKVSVQITKEEVEKDVR